MPILKLRGTGFEFKATFNPMAIVVHDTFFIFYRAENWEWTRPDSCTAAPQKRMLVSRLVHAISICFGNNDLPTGIYFYKLQVGQITKIGKFQILR